MISSRVGGCPRVGVLLRVTFQNREVGYASYQSWPELNNAFSQSLSKFYQALFYARQSAVALTEKRSLWDGLSVPPSHFLIPSFSFFEQKKINLENLKKNGFLYIKLKVGRNPKDEASLLRSRADEMSALGFKVRLDFNASLSYDNLQYFLEESGSSFCSIIDFLEDPLSLTTLESEWCQIRAQWNIPLALDLFSIDLKDLKQKSLQAVSVLVWKPAYQKLESILQLLSWFPTLKLVVTSDLGHPLEQLSSAWEASRLVNYLGRDRLQTCGLLSSVAYEPLQGGFDLESKGPFLIPPSGFGFGLEEKIESHDFDWRALFSRTKTVSLE